jgi:electron transport complex protein RnfD
MIMTQVLIALAPVTVFGVVLYGFYALLVIVVSIVAAVAGEALFRLLIKRESRITDLSAVVTGLLFALVLPPETPLWMAALGAVFATVVAKEFFGGLGANIFNPALAGRAFLLMSFPAALTRWTRPRGALSSALDAVSGASAGGELPLDAISGVTPLGVIKMGGAISDVGRELAASGLSAGEDYLSTMRTLFFGNHGGTIGESSILLILAGCFYLLVTRIIDWRAPLAMTASAFVLSLFMGNNSAFLGMDPAFALFNVLSGGLLFGAVFMITDYTTAPITTKGKLIFGAAIGVLVVLIRRWGNFPEGTMYAILIMNAVTPFLNRLLQKKYGMGVAK